MDLYNDLDHYGITLTTILVGQKELVHQRSAFINGEKFQIVGRFMRQEYQFKGITSLNDLKICLMGYDDYCEYPSNSNWSFTKYFLSDSFIKCVKIFNKARQNGDVCPHAFAFVLWKMECEGIDALWKIENHNKSSETYEFKCLNERFSIFLDDAFMTHLAELLNPISTKGGFSFMDCNISSMKYILGKILAHLLIERYIKWLEVVQNPEKYKRIYPDDSIPMYICKIPQKLNGEISFYFPEKRIDYMKNIIQDISKEFSCPFNRKVKYPPYKSPIRIAMDRMSY